jgi:hypothetical protein
MQTTAAPSPDKLFELQRITKQYAGYSRTSAGLANVLGGVLVFSTFNVLVRAASGLGPTALIWRPLMVSFPFVWIAARQWMQHHYYQREGRAEESVSLMQSSWTILSTWIIASVCLGFMVVGIRGASTSAHHLAGITSKFQLAVFVLATFAVPVIAWKFLATASDFIVCMFLVAQAALSLTGGPAHNLPSFAVMLLSFPAQFFAVFLFVRGIDEHVRFKNLQKNLGKLREQM